MALKIVIHCKIIKNTGMKKDEANSAHRVGDYYFTNHPAKFLQDRIKPLRVGALSVSTGYRGFHSFL